MINSKDNPVEWATLMYELEDAHEHLGALIEEMAVADDFDDIDYSIGIGHVFAHLNRAWNTRGDFGARIESDFRQDFSFSERSRTGLIFLSSAKEDFKNDQGSTNS